MKRILAVSLFLLSFAGHSQQSDSLLSAKPYYNAEQIALDRTLRQKIYEHVLFSLGKVEAFADSVSLLSESNLVHEYLQTWKVAFAEALLNSALQPDAIRSALDLRVFCMQHTRYFANGIGKNRFEEYTSAAVKLCIELEKSSIRLMDIVLQDGGKSQATLALFEGYAESHPLDNHYFIRETTTALSDQIVKEGKVKMKAMAVDMAEQINVLSERMNLYMAIMPKITLWRSERMLLSNTTHGALANRLDSMESYMAQLIGVTQTGMPWMNDMMLMSLQHISQERLEMQKFLTHERKLAFHEVDSQRVAIMQDMRVFRDETFDMLFNEGYSGFAAGEHYASRFLDGIFIRLAALIVLFGIVLLLALRIGNRSKKA